MKKLLKSEICGSINSAQMHCSLRKVNICGYCSLNSSRKCWLFNHEQCICALFMDPQIPLFSNFFIKNGSHGTIYTFKNYFATMFSVFSFQFQQNKFYPNRPLELLSKVITFFFSRITNIHEESTLWRIVSSIRGSTHYKKHNRIVKHINLSIRPFIES